MNRPAETRRRGRRRSGLRTALASAAAVTLAATGLAAIPSSAVAAADGLVVQYRTTTSGATTYESEPWLKVRNAGSTSVPLSSVKVRYYFKADSASAAYRFACSWAVKGCANITGTFGTPASPTATADRYLEIGFTPGAGSLAPGADSGDLQLRFHQTSWGPLLQSDDHSFGPQQSAYGDWSKVTAHVNGSTVWGEAPGGDGPADPPVLFDDFNYSSHTDPRLQANGWSVRSGSGGPGLFGATWDPSGVTFASQGGNSVMNLEASTAGTAASTKHTEFSTRSMKFKNGTYASRVKFTDAPRSGPDGDHIVQTFFAINDLTAPMADDYAEYDFEYLPNGGWGEPANILYATSWETYRPEPWETVNAHTVDRRSYAGWRDLVVTIDDDEITYYVDGEHFATHGADYLPERPMVIAFNHWLIDLAGQPSTTPRAYDQQVDYVLHVKDQVLTPAQVNAMVGAYRSAGTTFEDTVPAG
ncbi:cellulose binding domain-containing protein [Streptomyces sp. NPDC059452]|uniref:cellulose binding domain-containing protein n=1 Tax=Streptomyces sp. NPDC059452 TaxID=3346835 RepID=UPI00367CFBA1